jgi:molybdopterin synthase sulfur carrier subunit
MPDSNTSSVATITLRLVYLARLRDAFGTSGEALSLAPDHATTTRVLATLRARGGAWAQELAPGRAVRVAVNHDLAAGEIPLRDGDEVALLPPVTGG